MMDDRALFQVPGVMTKFISMAHSSMRIHVDTQENISPDMLHNLLSMKDKVGYFTFCIDMLDFEDITDLPKIDKTTYSESKSPSQRLRAVLFLLHKQKGGKPEDFNEYYDNVMEKLINKYKDMLE